MVVKTEDDASSDGRSTIAYPAVETIHEDSICKLVYAPARGVSEKVQQEAQGLARKAVGSLWGKGVFGVELFLMDDGKSMSHLFRTLEHTYHFRLNIGYLLTWGRPSHH